MVLDRLMTWRSLLAAMMMVLAPAAASIGRAQEVVVIVDGEPITDLDIEQRSKFTQLATRKTPSREEVIDELRKEKLKMHEARKAGLEVSDSEVDEA
jgi:peptidyl-prolyl cis-trans isomerase SurA